MDENDSKNQGKPRAVQDIEGEEDIPPDKVDIKTMKEIRMAEESKHLHDLENFVAQNGVHIVCFLICSIFSLAIIIKREPNSIVQSYLHMSNSAIMLILGYLFGKRDSKN
jgi:hypothetical protein